MIRKISIRTRVGWISVFEKEGKIFKIIFGRLKNQIKSKILSNYKPPISSRVHSAEGQLIAE